MKDIGQLVELSKALLPAGFVVLMMWQWFPDSLMEILNFSGKGMIGIGLFLTAWEVGKNARR